MRNEIQGARYEVHGTCAAHIGMGGVTIEKEPLQERRICI
jgi:hypothetical protein